MEIESKGDEDSGQHPKGSKPTNPSEIPSTSILRLPAELISEILVRLPVKTLLQIRCVSNSWLALISNPDFIKTHLSFSVGTNHKDDTHHIHMLIRGISDGKCIFKGCPLRSVFGDCIIEGFDLDYPTKDGKFLDFFGSCNGLIFLICYTKCLFLWNPTISKCKRLPDFRSRLKENINIVYGFGYDELHDDYKVVGICCGGSDYIEVRMYSLKSDSWSNVDCCGDILYDSDSSRKMKLNAPGRFVNGKLHWDKLHWDTISSPDPIVRKGCSIISFDLADQKWEKVDKPFFGRGDTELGVGVFGSDLSIFRVYNGTQLDVWVMREYGIKESWMKMFTLRYPNDQNFYPPPFFMSNKGEIAVMCGSIFMIYNSIDHSLKYSKVFNCNGCYGKEIYVESLVSPFLTEGTELSTEERLRKLRSKESSSK